MWGGCMGWPLLLGPERGMEPAEPGLKGGPDGLILRRSSLKGSSFFGGFPKGGHRFEGVWGSFSFAGILIILTHTQSHTTINTQPQAFPEVFKKTPNTITLQQKTAWFLVLGKKCQKLTSSTTCYMSLQANKNTLPLFTLVSQSNFKDPCDFHRELKKFLRRLTSCLLWDWLSLFV